MEHKNLDSFVLVYNNEIISPMLTTTREYGTWFSSTFDNYTSGQRLFLKTRTNEGKSVLVRHSGTRIGDFFDTRKPDKYELKCWFLKADSNLIKQLTGYNLADKHDCMSRNGERFLRVYTIQQIEYYVQMLVDKRFRISNMVLQPKKIQVDNMADVVKPNCKPNKRRLF